MARRFVTPLICLLAAPAAVVAPSAGCQQHSAKPQAAASAAKREPLPEAPPKLVETWQSGPVNVARGVGGNTGPAVMAHGKLPLVYIADAGGTIRVADRTAGRDLAAGPVARRTLVRVDGRRGVIFGSDEMLKGPLADDHEYVIYLETEQADNTVRRGTFRPGPRESGAPAQNEPMPVEKPETDSAAQPGGP